MKLLGKIIEIYIPLFMIITPNPKDAKTQLKFYETLFIDFPKVSSSGFFLQGVLMHS